MSEILHTQRLTLRAPSANDLAALVPLIGDYDVAKNLTVVPHPYTMEHAQQWLDHVTKRRAANEGQDWSILAGDAFIGVVSVGLYQGRFSLGYWLGKPWWGQGYATEAALAAVTFAFATRPLGVMVSGYFADNPASGRVLAKLGFEPAGIELVRCASRGEIVDCHRVLLTREEFVQKKAA